VRLTRLVAIACTTSAALALAVGSVRTSSARSLSPSVDAWSGEQREVARIRSHFDSVLTELQAAPAPPGSDGARRGALIDALRAYRERGVFPHNYDFPGRAVPYFVDRKTGTLCAVAHLLEATGRRDIVDRVASENNNVWVAQLASDTAFARWLARNGISLAEAARIQVPYMEPATPAQVARNTAFLIAAPIAFSSAAVTTVLNAFGNADGHQRASRIVGFASGVVSVGLGTALMTKPDQPRQIGMLSAAVGGLSIALAARATGRHDTIVAQRRAAEQSRGTIQASLSPVVGGGGSGSGLAVTIRY
jgi:hypothetical protein